MKPHSHRRKTKPREKPSARAGADEELDWHDIKEFSLEGKGWSDTEQFFDRLPAKAKDIVRPPVWKLAQNTAGISARFITDATQITARWTVRFPSLAMDHMPATGVSGLDLYVMIARQWRWIGVGRATESPTNTFRLVSSMSPGRREFRLYLPLYNGIESLEIGVPASARISDIPPQRKAKTQPICIYGTSITQGGCVSRPGMAFPSILGRRLGREIINLGFSGNGQAEPEMARLLAELDPSVYVLDCMANISADMVLERMPGMVRTLRAAHEHTPIVLVEQQPIQEPRFVTDRYNSLRTKNAALKSVFKALRKSGMRRLDYVASGGLLEDDGEATVDGLHATDVGNLRIAAALEPVLRSHL